jgi:hypothetical protein
MENKKEEKFAITKDINLFQFGRTDIGALSIVEKFNARDPWILFGINNDTPQELIRLLQNADGVHSAIIKKKTDMIAGNGFVENPALDQFFKNQYSKEDLAKVAYKIAYDIVVFGGYYLNIVWSQDRKTVAKIQHVPFEKVRIAKPTDPECEEVEGYYISRNWLAYRKEENKPYFVKAFTKDDESVKAQYPSQLLFSKVYLPGMEFYSLPSYFPIMNYVKLSYEISNFHLRAAQNSYFPNLIVSIPHVPNPIERQKMSEEIKARSGTDGAGQTVVLFGESIDKMPKFDVINPMQSDTKFKDLSVQVNENIYAGHNANAIVAGIPQAGKLGNTDEVLEQYAIFQTTVITPLQHHLEETFNMLAGINGYPETVELKEYTAVSKLKPTVPNETPETVNTLK